MIWSRTLCKWLPRPSWMSAATYAHLPHIAAVAGACAAAGIIITALPLAPSDRGAAVVMPRAMAVASVPDFAAPVPYAPDYGPAPSYASTGPDYVSTGLGYAASSYLPPPAIAPPGAPVDVPEPGSVGLLVIGVLGLVVVRGMVKPNG